MWHPIVELPINIGYFIPHLVGFSFRQALSIGNVSHYCCNSLRLIDTYQIRRHIGLESVNHTLFVNSLVRRNTHILICLYGTLVQHTYSRTFTINSCVNYFCFLIWWIIRTIVNEFTKYRIIFFFLALFWKFFGQFKLIFKASVASDFVDNKILLFHR